MGSQLPKMRLLLLLSFLGFRPVINSSPAPITSTVLMSSAIPNLQSSGFNSTGGNESISKETRTPTMSTASTKASTTSATSVKSTQSLTTTKISTASTQITHLSTSQTEELSTPTTVESRTSSNQFVNTTSVTSSQKVSSTKATSVTESNTSQNGSTVPTVTTTHTEVDRNSTETSTARSTQMSVSTQTLAVNTIDSMMGNTTSGTSNRTQSSTADVTRSKEGNTQGTNGSASIQSEIKCKKEASQGPSNVTIPKNFSCENFVKEKGKDLAEKACSTLAKNQNNIDKCEIWLSSKEEQLFVEVYYRVIHSHIKEILPELEKRIEEMKEYAGGIQSTQRKLTQSRGENTDSLQTENQNDSMELKKLIAMAVTGSLLLLIFLAGVVYRCSQHKSKHKDPYLTEELRTVDNGCHDNPAMDITERDSEMEEKNYSKATFLENTDGWIVPMDTHIKDELEEEDTHL